MLAYTYPLLNIFWSMLMFLALVAWFVIVIWVFVDNFRRSDHSGLAKAGWAFLIVFLPIVGVFFYLITRPALA